MKSLPLLLLLLTFSTFTLAAADKRPNILLILADDMGFSDLGCYGSEIATPNLDRLASNGLRFTQMYNTSKCNTTRACLLTGAYPQQVGMMSHAVIKNAVTLGEALRPAGYRTLWTGKHHGTENPFTRGFDRYYGLRDGACNYFNPGPKRDGEAQPAQKRSNRAWCIDGETILGYTPPQKDFYTTDYFTNYALDYLEEYKDDNKPFLLYVAYTAPHDPMHAWPDDIAKYEGKYDAGWEVTRQARIAKQKELGLFPEGTAVTAPDYNDWDALADRERDDQIRRMEVYAAMVDRLDQNIGRLLDKLEALGELDNTLIMFASDNGGSAENVQIGKGKVGEIDRWSSVQGRWANVSNTPFKKYKTNSYEGGICTSFIAHWPKGITVPANSIVRTPLHFVDFMPTLLELAKTKYPAQTLDQQPITPLQGTSFVPLLKGKSITRELPLYWQWAKGKAIREGDWKAVNQGGKRWELYDLAADRTEINDLSNEHPERTADMVKRWETWYASTPVGQPKKKKKK